MFSSRLLCCVLVWFLALFDLAGVLWMVCVLTHSYLAIFNALSCFVYIFYIISACKLSLVLGTFEPLVGTWASRLSSRMSRRHSGGPGTRREAVANRFYPAASRGVRSLRAPSWLRRVSISVLFVDMWCNAIRYVNMMKTVQFSFSMSIYVPNR